MAMKTLPLYIYKYIYIYKGIYFYQVNHAIKKTD